MEVGHLNLLTEGNPDNREVTMNGGRVKKELEWRGVDPDDKSTYPQADARFLFKRRGKAYAFFYGVHDGFGMVRSLLRKKGRELVVCTLKDIECFAEDGSTDPYAGRER